MMFQIPGIYRTIGNYKQAINNLSQQTGIPAAQIEHDIAANLQKAQEAALSQSSSLNTETPTQNVQDAPLVTSAPEVSSGIETEAQAQEVQNPDYVFIPNKHFTSLIENHPELAELQTIHIDDIVDGRVECHRIDHESTSLICIVFR